MSKQSFLNNLNEENNTTFSSKGAIVYSSSLNALLDFYGQVSAMRNMSEREIINLFEKSYYEDKLRTIKCVFYLGDILQGQGERRTFRILIKHIANNHTKDLLKNIKFIPEFNRWDSLYELFDTPLEKEVIELLRGQLLKDMMSNKPSLAAKWCKSCNASSKKTRELGKKTARLLNLNNFDNIDTIKAKKENEYTYRKILSHIRAKLNIVERDMSANRWDCIKYNFVPSKAMSIYNKAFNRHDEDRFTDYIDGLKKGETKINSKVLYPYEVIKKIIRNPYRMTDLEKNIADAQWNALPNYIGNADMKGLCVVDVSGSMDGIPMEVAISTGLYVAERCSGVYHNKFITFSENPQLVSVKGDNIFDKVMSVRDAGWGFNTNLERVFSLILNTAIKNNSPQEDIPDYLIILTDMGWDSLQGSSSIKKSFIKTMRDRFNRAGYEMPILVLWNIDGRVSPMTADENGWISVSGYSPTIFKALLSEELLGAEDLSFEKIDPVEAMLITLDSERYEDIII